MLVEFNDLPRCNCGAVFLTEQELGCHNQESETFTSLYKELIRFAFAQLERLQIHSAIQDNNDAVDAKPCSKHKDANGQFHCPRWGCDFKAGKPNQLLRHYGRYIPLYNEPPCVRCGKPADTIGQFLEHAKQHSDDTTGDSKAKNDYTPRRCDELRKIRDERLGSEESKIRAPPASSKKRKSAPSKKGKSAPSRKRTTAEVAHTVQGSEQVETESRSHAIESHHDPQASFHANSKSTISATPNFRAQRLSNNFPLPPTNANSRLQTTEFAKSKGPALPNRIDGGISITYHNPLDTLPQLGTSTLTGQDAFFDCGAATGSTGMPVPPISHHGSTAQYAPLNMDGVMGEPAYDLFGPIVNALNFAIQ